ncbi:DNA breaking-rejoining enzyme [Desarmillaria tabescens]|uniref:DNA breaking-rejoining enzyme n=1 Tax=Armillaria tabescens TaxID=1929756 RepID=A0AA39NLR3_ARMTA|nr:DNA breaking-rejoining enzyme [Desarmillaria tabescens]KAK0467798.1 DNA breaking-rejoining enzyme [Desarmillaria tabescens]
MYRIRFRRASASADAPQSGGLSLASTSLPHPVGGNSVPSKSPDPTLKSPRVKKGSSIEPSDFRPLRLASQRIPYWKTPYSINSFALLSSIYPQHLITAWKDVMLASVTEDTLKNYGAGLLRFTQFCDKFRIPEDKRMPADDTLLSIFVAEMGAGKVKKSTIDTWIDGIKLWHEYNNAPWLGGDMLLRTKKGADTLAPHPCPEEPKLPVTQKHIDTLHKHLDLSDPFDCAVWAAALTAWKGCTRLGEILLASPSQFDPTRNVLRRSPRTTGTAANNHSWISIFIPYTKTKKYQGDWVTLTSAADPTDPLSAIQHHLDVNSDIPDDAPLFAFRSGETAWTALDRKKFMTRCNSIWEAEGLQTVLGHSFRIGGATFLLLSGVDPWVVMKQGRWSSKAFLRYWRSIEEILPLFIGDSLDNFRSLKESMSRLASINV